MDDELILMRSEDYLTTIDEAKQECITDKEHEKGLCPETFGMPHACLISTCSNPLSHRSIQRSYQGWEVF